MTELAQGGFCQIYKVCLDNDKLFENADPSMTHLGKYIGNWLNGRPTG